MRWVLAYAVLGIVCATGYSYWLGRRGESMIEHPEVVGVAAFWPALVPVLVAYHLGKRN